MNTVKNVFHEFNVYCRGLIVCIKQQHPPQLQIYTWKYSTDVAVIQRFLQQLRVFDTDFCAKLVLDLSCAVPCILCKQTSKQKNPYFIVTFLSLKLTYLLW